MAGCVWDDGRMIKALNDWRNQLINRTQGNESDSDGPFTLLEYENLLEISEQAVADPAPADGKPYSRFWGGGIQEFPSREGCSIGSHRLCQGYQRRRPVSQDVINRRGIKRVSPLPGPQLSTC